jgi:hypothetical protein
MTVWWDSLPLFSQIMYAIAIPSTIILIIQLILNFVAGNDAETDSDVSGLDDVTDLDGLDDVSDGDFDGDTGELDDGDFTPKQAESLDADLDTMRVFTLRGIVALLCSFSWTALAIYATGAPFILALAIGLVVGVAMMFAVAKLIQVLLGLAENGTVDFSGAIGYVGKVYIPIPPGGLGKIIITFDGTERECEAKTFGDTLIATDTDVRVCDIDGETLIVETI